MTSSWLAPSDQAEIDADGFAFVCLCADVIALDVKRPPWIWIEANKPLTTKRIEIQRCVGVALERSAGFDREAIVTADRDRRDRQDRSERAGFSKKPRMSAHV